MRRSFEFSVCAFAVLLGGCGDKTSAGTASSSAAAAQSGSAAAKPLACTDPKATMHADPTFCITVPDGFNKPKEDPGDQKVHFKYERGPSEFMDVAWYVTTWKPARFEELKKLDWDEIKNDKDKTVIEEGSTPDKKSSFILYKNGSGQRWITVLGHNHTMVFECISQDWEKEPKDTLAACKTLELPE